MDKIEIPKPAWLQKEDERIRNTSQPLGNVPRSTRSATPSAEGTGTAPVVLGAEAGTLPTDKKYSSEIATGIKRSEQQKSAEKREKKAKALRSRLGLGR